MQLTRKEIKEQRKAILSQSVKTTLIRKGDKRISSATRFCAVCKRPLSTLVRSTGDTIATVAHSSCQLSDLVRINICTDIHSCYRHIGGD